MSDVEILHNPRCSKSRAAMALLQARGIEPRIRLYLEQPLGIDELRTLHQRLAVPVRDMVRGDEPAFAEAGLSDSTLDDDAVLAAVQRHPILLQRPIVVAGERAVIGRPPENVLALL